MHITSSQYSMAKVKLGTKSFSVDSEVIDASFSQVSDAECVAFCARLSAGDFKRLRVLHLVSAFLLFLLLFVLRVFRCCEESGRLTLAVQGHNDIGAEGGKALGEALKVNNSVQILKLVSAILVVFVGFCFACVLLLRGVRAADVCGAGGQRYRCRGRQGAGGSAEGQ